MTKAKSKPKAASRSTARPTQQIRLPQAISTGIIEAGRAV